MSGLGLSDRMRRIKVSPTSAAAQRVREMKAQGRDILDLTIGEPDFDTPDHVRAAAVAAIDRGETKYTSVNGLPALREAIAAKIRRRTGATYAADRITVGGGAKQIIFMALMASLDPADEVIIPAPYWVSYPDMTVVNAGKPVIVACPQAQGFKLTARQLDTAVTSRTRWLILNTPGNPTGVAYRRQELRAIADVLVRHPRIGVLTDEIYDEIWYEPSATSSLVTIAPELADRILLVNGVSKTYAMTGWRIGYAAGPAPLIDAINVLQSHSSSCPSSISQAAAIAALNGSQDFVAKSVAVYKERCDRTVRLLNAIPGIECVMPSGAFYLFPSCAGVIGKRTPDGKVLTDDQAFILHLLDSAGVVAIHGSAYGMPGYFRISIATSKDVLEQACTRIASVCSKLR